MKAGRMTVWNVRLKIHDPTGEIYYLSFTRKDLKITSYESDNILTKVDTWADGVAALNQPPQKTTGAVHSQASPARTQ